MARILVIEDEPNVRANLVEILELMEYEVRGATDGLEGIEIAREFSPHVVLCDVRMPRADGFEVLQALRQAPNTRESGVIMLTAHTDTGVRQKGIAAGADEFLTKPISVDDLMRAVERMLDHTPISDK